MLDHINFSDLGWRPYSWWYLDEKGGLADLRLFTRNKKKKHITVCSRPPLCTHDPQWPRGYENWLPEDAQNLAESYTGIMARDEAFAGMRTTERLVYILLSDVITILRRISERSAKCKRRHWLKALLSQAQGRIIGESGKLEPCNNLSRAPIVDNASAIAALGVLGDVEILGGSKMIGYWNDVLTRAAAASSSSGSAILPPRSVDVSGLSPCVKPPLPSSRLQQQLNQVGIGYSQAMAVAEHGAYACYESISR